MNTLLHLTPDISTIPGLLRSVQNQQSIACYERVGGHIAIVTTDIDIEVHMLDPSTLRNSHTPPPEWGEDGLTRLMVIVDRRVDLRPCVRRKSSSQAT